MSLNIKEKILAIILFVFFSALYVYTAPPGVYDGDSGEIAAAVNTLGLAHPTGFPLYMITGKLFTILFPIWDVAYRLNVFSALLTASALVFVYYTLRNLGSSSFASLTASFVLGIGRNTIWKNASTTNIYSISLLFISILLFIFNKWKKERKISYLYWYGFTWGLSMGTHILTVVAVVPLLFMLWKERRVLKDKVSIVAKTIFLTLIPATQYIYLIFAYRRDGIITWGSMEGFKDFIYYITQRGYSDKIFTRSFSEFIIFFEKVISLLTTEFSVALFFIGVIGFVILYKKDKIFFIILMIILLSNLAIMFGYGKSETDLLILNRYMFISYLVLAIGVAFGIDELVIRTKALKNNYRIVFFSLAILVVILFQFKSAFADNNRKNNYLVEDMAHNILKTAEPNSIILAFGDPVVDPLWYFQSIGERQDLIIISVNLVSSEWYLNNLARRYSDTIIGELKDRDFGDRLEILIRDNIGKRSVYAAFDSGQNLEQIFDFIPQGLLNKIVLKGTVSPADIKLIVSGNKLIWDKYTMRSLRTDYSDYQLNSLAKIYASTLYRTGIIYYNSGFIDESLDSLGKSLEIFPDPIVQKDFDFILNKK